MVWTPRQKRIVQPTLAECSALGLSLGAGMVLGGGGAAAAPWSPSQFGGLRAWYQADLGVLNASDVAAANNDAVKTWQDQSGTDPTHKHATQATAGKRPLLKTSVAGIAGAAALLFDGTDDTLATLTWASALPQPFSWFVVAADDGTGTTQFALEGNIDGSNRSILGGSVISNGYSTYSGTELKTGARGSTAFHLLGGINNGGNPNSFVFLDSMTGVAGAAGTNGVTAMTIGSSYAGTAPWKGYIAFALVAAGVASLADRAALRLYLMAKYGLTIGAAA